MKGLKMALREDYYEPCADEIDRRLRLIEQIKTDITPIDYDGGFGIENSNLSEDIEDEYREVFKILDEMLELLEREKRKLADDISDVGGWL